MIKDGFILKAHRDIDDEIVGGAWDSDNNDFSITAFQTSEFLEPFYSLMPANCGPVVVTVTEAASGRLAMVFFLIQRIEARMVYIEAPDLELMDYFAPATARWFNPSAAEMTSIWTQLLGVLPGADVLSLKKIPGLLPDGRPNPLLLLPGTVSMGTTTKAISLQNMSGAENYTRSGIYKDAKRLFRRMQKEGDVSFRVAQTQEDASELFEHMLAQRIARFRALERPDPLSDPWVQAFYRRRAVEGVPTGNAHLSGLYVDGQCIATDFSFIHRNRRTRILTAIAQNDLERFSPGTVLFSLVLDEARDCGVELYDLGVGEIGYKLRFPGETAPIHEHHVALSMRGRMAVLQSLARRMVRLGVKRYPQLRAPAEKLRTRLQRLLR
jgi:CelD/BcsL family acetyltransferase involved in cellulose biosynthesis